MSDANTAQTVNPQLLQEFVDELQAAQSFVPALIYGLLAAITGALLWMGATMWSGYQIGWLVVIVGWMVGVAVRMSGHGVHWRFGVLGAALATFGAVLGNVCNTVFLLSRGNFKLFFQLLPQVPPQEFLSAMGESFQTMDLLFYGLAIYAGYHYAMRRISDAELARLV